MSDDDVKLSDIDPQEMDVLLTAPTPAAQEYLTRLLKAMDDYTKEQEEAGHAPMIADPISAVIGLLGILTGGVEPEERRDQLYRGCGVMLRIAMENARAAGTTAQVMSINKGTGTMQ